MDYIKVELATPHSAILHMYTYTYTYTYTDTYTYAYTYAYVYAYAYAYPYTYMYTAHQKFMNTSTSAESVASIILEGRYLENQTS